MKGTYSIFILLFLLISCSTTKSKFDFEKVLWATDWSHDEKYIAVGGNNNKLKILTSDNLELYKSLDKLNTITKIKWHPTENLIAIARQGSNIERPDEDKSQIINLDDGSSITLDVLYARGLGWSPNGNMLAVGDGEGELRIYSKSGHLIKEIETEQKSITGLSWHPSSGRIVTVGSHIEIIDIAKEERIKVIPREIEILMLSVEWHPSGEYFVTGDYGDNILNYPALLMFWKPDGSMIKKIEGSKAEYRNLNWAPGGNLLVTASDKVRIWDKEGELIKERNLGSLLWGIDWNRKGNKIVTTTNDGKIFVLDKELKVLQKLK